MKICMLTDAWTPVWGGGQAHVWEVSQRLRNDYGCQVEILAPNLADDSRVVSLGPRFVFPSFWGRTLYLVHALVWMLRQHYDIYHSHCYLAVLLPIVKLFHPKSKVVYTVHGAGVDLLGGGFLNLLKIPQTVSRWLLYDYPWDALFTVARTTIKQPTQAKLLVVIGNGVDTKQFDLVKSNKDSRVFQLLWVGRDDPVKGLKLLQSAFATLRKKYPQVRLKIVKNEKYANVIKAFKQSDIFVLPSLSEGFPLTVLEAMAAGLPVVATKVGGIPEMVKDRETGYLVEPGNIQALAEVLEKAVKNEKLEKMGLAGWNIVRHKYSWDKVAQKVYEVYQKISDQ